MNDPRVYIKGVMAVCINVSAIIATMWFGVAFVRYLIG